MLDSQFNLEVFDEFVLAGNSVSLSCQAPASIAAQLDYLAWLKDDKIIVSQEEERLAQRRRQKFAASGAADEQAPVPWEPQVQKYLMLPRGQLYIRNATKADSAAYKCRARNRLTGQLVTSQISAQLVVDESRSKSELKVIKTNPLVWVHENAQAFVCSYFQSYPVAKFTWFRESNQPNGERERLNLDLMPEMRQVDSCLLIQQAQLKHSTTYTCEANNGDSIARSSTKLVVTSAQLTAQILFTQLQSVRGEFGVASLPLQANANHQTRSNQSNGQQQQQQQQQTVSLGSTIQLNCSINGFPYDTITWFKDSKLFALVKIGEFENRTKVLEFPGEQSKPIKVVQSTVILIENFELKDRGVYQCQVYSAKVAVNKPVGKSAAKGEQMGADDQVPERDYLRSASASIQLDLAFVRPTIVQKFQTKTLAKGSPLSIHCSSTGLPSPKIYWLLDGFFIAPSGARIQAPRKLASLESNFENSNYAHNSVTEIDLGYALADDDEIMNNVYSEPIEDERFVISSHLQTATSPTNLPTVVSYLNVSQLSATETGRYKCLAINPLGSAQFEAQINVLGGLELRAYQPANVSLIVGKSSSLQCPLIGFPLSQVDWFQHQQRLPTNHRQRVEPVKLGSGGQLELSNVDKTADSGVYVCGASMQNNGSSPETVDDYDDLVGQVTVNVRVPPMIDSQSLPEMIQANEGMRTKLVCSVVQGDHPVEIRWLRRISDGSKVTTVGRFQVNGFELMQNFLTDHQEAKSEDSITIHNLEDSCLLTFKQISYTDSADYLCLAQNEAGKSVRSTRIIVNVAPSWSSEPSGDINVLLGDRLQLDCMAHGFPQPSVLWKRESQSSSNQQSWLLADRLKENPSTLDQSRSQNDSPQALVTFSDIVSSYRQRVYNNGSLIIDQVDQVDAGAFMCEVTNGIGTGLSKVVRVKVNVPPYFKQRAFTYLSQVGSKAELKCIVNGDQPMVVGWRKDTEIIDLVNDSRRRLISEHKLSVQNFESVLTVDNLARNDSGQYVCIASNEFGTEDMQVQLIVQEPPEAPILLRPIRASSRQAAISFRKPYSGNSPIRKYSIMFKQLVALDHEHAMNQSQARDLTGWQQMLVDAPPASELSDYPLVGNETRVTERVNGNDLVTLDLCCLQPFTRYMVKVKALNEIGSGETSKPAQFMTDEEAIGGPPLDVGVEATGAHSLKVRWRPPARHLQNGLIRGYYIGYRAISPSPMGSSGGSNFDDSLKGAQPKSVSSNVRVFEESEQYQYKNVQLDLSLNNHRQFPIPITVNQEFILSPEEDFAQSLFNNSAPQVYTSYLTNLRRKTAYSIIVQAYNKIGAGPRSDQISVSTLDAAPPMSPILRLVSVSYSSAQFVWSSRRFEHDLSNRSLSQAGAKPSPVIAIDESPADGEDEADDPQSFFTISYRVETKLLLSGGSNEDWQQRRIQERHQMPYTLENLRCGSKYAAFMTATNSLGQSEPGEVIKFTTMGAAPIAPSNSRDFISVNLTLVVLRLSAWQNAGCLISSFIIKYKQSNQAKWTMLEHQVLPTLQTVTISGSAMFSTRPLNSRQNELDLGESEGVNHEDGGYSLSHSAVNKRQNISDFIIRNLVSSSVYKLIVEATSEAGVTMAEYEFETANFSSSTIAINVNGIVATGSNVNGRLGSRDDPTSPDSSDSGDLDFSYSGGQRASSPFQRYNMGVWSLTVLFVLASASMTAIALILGFRSIMRMKLAANQRDSFLWTTLCCQGSSSSSSGAESSQSSSGGTCYQVPDHPMDAYCSLPAGHGLVLSASELSPTRMRFGATCQSATSAALSNQMGAFEGGELKSLVSNPVPFRQLVSSSSLSTIGNRFSAGNSHHSHTLRGGTDYHARRYSGDEIAQNHIRAHYAATLGKHTSIFQHESQPTKYNEPNSSTYGQLRPKAQASDRQSHNLGGGIEQAQENSYQLFHPVSLSGTSGYETGNSVKMNSDSEMNPPQPVCLSGLNAFNMSLYGCNLFDPNDRQQAGYEQGALNENGGINREQSQSQLHYNMANDEIARNQACQQQPNSVQQLSAGAYRMMFEDQQPSSQVNKLSNYQFDEQTAALSQRLQ